MKARHIGLTRHCYTVLIAVVISAGIAAAAPYALAQTVTCNETVLSVNASDIKAEELIKAIVNECGIKMMLRGELFTEDVFSVRFENMPIRAGLERILRVVNIPNHMMHFETVSGRHRVIGVDLIGKKGGERQLTPEEDRISQPAPKEAKKRPEQKKPMTLPEETEESQREEGKEPNRDELRETLQQELPVEIQSQIPEEELDKMEQLTDDTEKTRLEQQQEEVQKEKVMERPKEILDTQVENGTEPDPAEVRKMLQQTRPPEMQGQIPEEVLKEREQLTEE